ncbi:Ig mu chain C region membrane-bound form [Pteropus alecto]|uniref:Ig mu chain C region n=1 Tax=Pteropus alecto TaxID=9402 RepID=L5L5B6_PTEAL|nr:Ig mu chain C region membrane-bound form [Pteropus alecto]
MSVSLLIFLPVLGLPWGASSAPNLFPLVSCENLLLDESLVAMGCLARDFLPSSVSFSWTYKNSSAVGTSAITSFPPVLREGSYLATSQLFLPSADILRGSDDYVTCNVKHTSGDRKVKIPLTPPEDLPPNVTVFTPPRDAFSSNSQRTSKLLCEASGFSPRQISVSWLRDGKQVDSGVTMGKVEAEPKGSGPLTYRVTSSLVITEIQWLSQSVFTCQVEHGDQIFKKNVSSMCSSSASTGIRIFTTPPSFASIFLTKTATLSCLVTDLATYDSLDISWTRQNGEVLKTRMNVSESHPNATFSARGETTMCVEDWQSGEEFTCTVTHTDLPSPLKQTVFKPKDVGRHVPSVYVLPPTREQLGLQELASITCLVKGFSPSDVFVRWMQRGQPMAPSTYVTSAPMPEPQTPDLYFVYSILTVNTEDWLSGETYTCVVGHEALPHSVTERTVDKSTEGELGAEEEGFENLNAMASTFIVLFLLSLFYSTTVTLFKVGGPRGGVCRGWPGAGPTGPPTPTFVPSRERGSRYLCPLQVK